MKPIFRIISNKVSVAAGSAATFSLAVLVIIAWGITGPAFGFSDTWQLIINTGTTIVTFLMVFLIQNTQNRDGKAVQLKLDELIRVTQARDAFVGLEQLSDEELDQLDKDFKILHDKQSTSPVMKKLHETLLVEHHRRKLISSTAFSDSAAKINELFHKKSNPNS